MKNFILIPFTIVLFGAMVSCATVDQKLTLAPISAPFPVSASQSLYAKGTVISSNQFSKSKPFAIVTKVKVPFKATESKVDFGKDLKAELAGTDYNGVTQLQVQVANVDASLIGWIPWETEMGTILALVGGTTATIGVGANVPGALVPGLVITGIGAGFIGLGIYQANTGTIDYTFNLNGVEVKY